MRIVGVRIYIFCSFLLKLIQFYCTHLDIKSVGITFYDSFIRRKKIHQQLKSNKLYLPTYSYIMGMRIWRTILFLQLFSQSRYYDRPTCWACISAYLLFPFLFLFYVEIFWVSKYLHTYLVQYLIVIDVRTTYLLSWTLPSLTLLHWNKYNSDALFVLKYY